MPSYFDPIAYDHVEITPNTIIYLVKNGDKFAIKALETGLEQLTHEPTTRATEYWKIDTVKLLNEQALNPIIFPKNHLTDESLTLNKVTEYLGIDPSALLPIRFATQRPVTIANNNYIEAAEYQTDAEDDETENDDHLVERLEVRTQPYLRFFNPDLPVVASYNPTPPRDVGFNNTQTESIINTQEQPVINAYSHPYPRTLFNNSRDIFSHNTERTNTIRRLLTTIGARYPMFDLPLHPHLLIELLLRPQEDTAAIPSQTFRPT